MTPLEFALDLAWNEVPVLPCNVEDRRPLTELTAASKNRETISGWWQRWPNAVPAVPSGRVSGLGVIHVDDLAHLTDVSRTWYDQHADLLRTTRTHHTPGGGRDYWFYLPGDVPTCCSAPVVVNGASLDGIKVCGDGGYSVFWPARGLRREGSVQPLPAEFHALFVRPDAATAAVPTATDNGATRADAQQTIAAGTTDEQQDATGLGKDSKAPKALGIDEQAWLDEHLKGYLQLPARKRREVRREAVRKLRAAGLSGRQIAATLGVDEKTVRNDGGAENSADETVAADHTLSSSTLSDLLAPAKGARK
jgi:hypothetical protein